MEGVARLPCPPRPLLIYINACYVVLVDTQPTLSMVGLNDVVGALQCVLQGAKDSTLGIWPVIQLIKK